MLSFLSPTKGVKKKRNTGIKTKRTNLARLFLAPVKDDKKRKQKVTKRKGKRGVELLPKYYNSSFYDSLISSKKKIYDFNFFF